MSDYPVSDSGLADYVDEPLLGTAQWMPPAKVAERYQFEDGDLWLGRNGDDERTPIGRNDSSHVLLCAKTRSGKGRALITNNLLLWPGSIFVNDPKGENASITAARRGKGSKHATESLGQKVCVLDSHETASVDPEYRAFYNPIAEIRPGDPDAETKAAIIAESCISSNKEKADPTWDNKAKTFIKTLILHIATDRFIPDADRNMVTLRRFISAGDFIAVGHIEAQLGAEELKANPPDGFMILLEGMKANQAFDGIISDQARSLMESYASQPKMWNSIRTSAEENTDWIDDNRIRAVLKPGKYPQSFTADELQSREGGISVYMCLPSGMKDHFASWPRIVVNMMLTAAQARGNSHPASGHQTLMMLDEFASMERMRRIETAAADIAGAGVKLFFVVQTLTQLKAIYGENWETFASSADTHIYYGFNDNFTAEYVSKRLGEVEVIRRLRSQSRADSTTTSDGSTKGGSTSTATSTSDARSRGGGRGSSSGGSSGTSDGVGWGPSIFFRTLATTNQFSRQSGRNYGSSRQTNFQRTKTKGKTDTEGTNWGETHTVSHGTTTTAGTQESLHKKPLAAINELMRLFGDVDDPTDPGYPGIGLVSKASGDPMLIHKCHYDEDRFFEGLFDPHPKWGFASLPEDLAKTFSKVVELQKEHRNSIEFGYSETEEGIIYFIHNIYPVFKNTISTISLPQRQNFKFSFESRFSIKVTISSPDPEKDASLIEDRVHHAAKLFVRLNSIEYQMKDLSDKEDDLNGVGKGFLARAVMPFSNWTALYNLEVEDTKLSKEKEKVEFHIEQLEKAANQIEFS